MPEDRVPDSHRDAVGPFLEIGVGAQNGPAIEAGQRVGAITPDDVGRVLRRRRVRILVEDSGGGAGERLAFGGRDGDARDRKRWIGTHDAAWSTGGDLGGPAAGASRSVATCVYPLRDAGPGGRSRPDRDELGPKRFARENRDAAQDGIGARDSLLPRIAVFPLEIFGGGGHPGDAGTAGDTFAGRPDDDPVPGVESVPARR